MIQIIVFFVKIIVLDLKHIICCPVLMISIFITIFIIVFF